MLESANVEIQEEHYVQPSNLYGQLQLGETRFVLGSPLVSAGLMLR